MTGVQPPPLPETQIDRAAYRPIGALGRSGLGEVILAAMSGPPGLERLARITCFWPELTESRTVVERFIAAAQTTQRLRHPNIVRTFELGADIGAVLDADTDPVLAPAVVSASSPQARCFVATEYVAGQPLGRILRRLRGSPDFTLQLRLEILVDILIALAYAHDRPDPRSTAAGMVHGDLNLDNILIGYDGQVKVVDFGLARALQSSADGVDLPRFTSLGHIAYLAPEQLRGQAGDRRADLFAVGVLLWEMVAERPMFGMSGVRSAFAPASALVGDTGVPALPTNLAIPPTLLRICQRALARDPDARYQLASDFRRDIEDQVISQLPAEARALGKVISHAFRVDKATVQTLIGRFVDVDVPVEEIVSEVVSQVELIDGSLGALGGLSLQTASVSPPVPPVPPPSPAAVPFYLSDRITGSLSALELPAVGSTTSPAQSGVAWARGPLIVGAVIVGAAITLVFAGWLRPPVREDDAGVTSLAAPLPRAPAMMDRTPTVPTDPQSARVEPAVPSGAVRPKASIVPSETLPARHGSPRPISAGGTAAGASRIDPENPYRP